MVGRFLFFAAFTWALAAGVTVAAAQGTRAEEVTRAFDQLQSSVAAAERSGALSEADKLVLARLKTQVRDLRTVYSIAPNTVWAGYSKVIGYEATLLQRAIDPAHAGETSTIVNAVASDIAAKRNFTLAIPAFGGQPPSSIKVTVVTKKDGKEESGFLIRCNPLLYADAQPMFFFNNPSSPTDADLAPGSYVFIAMKDGVVVARQNVTVGATGDTKAKVEVQVAGR